MANCDRLEQKDLSFLCRYEIVDLLNAQQDQKRDANTKRLARIFDKYYNHDYLHDWAVRDNMKKIITTDRAPKAIGPYSQAMNANGFIFTAGQIGLDPNSGEMVSGGIQEQTRRTLMNLQAVLLAAGSDLPQVVKTTVFLQTMDDFAVMNNIYSEFFPSQPPARSAIQAAGLPKGALVEIEAVAIHPDDNR